MSFGVWFKNWILAFINLLTFDYRKPKSDAQRKKERQRRIERKFHGGYYREKKKRSKRRSGSAVEFDKLFNAAMRFVGASLAILLLPFGLFDWGHKSIKVRKSKININKTKKSNSTIQNKKTYTTSKSSTTKTTPHTNRQTIAVKTLNKSKITPKPTNPGTTNYSHSVKKVETKSSASAPVERIRLFEMPTVQVEQKITVVEPDENTPKSTPKHEKDQYIRKRMIIAGSSYCDQDVLQMLRKGTYFDLEAEPDNPHDKDAIKLTYNGSKIGYIPKQDRLAFVTCLKLKRNIYGVITAINDTEFPTKYEFETWFDNA